MRLKQTCIDLKVMLIFLKYSLACKQALRGEWKTRKKKGKAPFLHLPPVEELARRLNTATYT